MSFSSNVRLKSFLLSLVLFFLISFGYYLHVLSETEGHYVYLIDDAYIHLAMAKNFALYDVWGITKYEFSSTSSSPLFTYLLSILIKLFGNNDQLPLYCNSILGIGIIYILNRYYADFFKNTNNRVIAVLFTVFFAVLHLQLLLGMEHVFHVFLLVVNIFCLSNLKNRAFVFGFYSSLLLMGLIRFESMFYFVSLAFVLVLMKKWKEAVAILLVGFIPIAIFCYVNYQHSGYLFPNSVVVKGTKLTFDSGFPLHLKTIMVDNFLLNKSFYKIGFFPVMLCLIFILRDFKKKNFHDTVKSNFLLIVLSLVMICHSMFADLKGAFRYEAYILTGFSMALIPKVSGLFKDFWHYIKKEKLISVLVLINTFLLLYKFSFAHLMLDNGGKNIYEQQIQSARFLHTYYNTSKVVANDIGAITYFTNIHLLDIVGLGSKEMIPFNENKKTVDQDFENFLRDYTQHNKYDIAVIYDEWFHGHVPKTWKKAAVLKISNSMNVSQDEVSVYSVNPEHLEQLKENIRQFGWNKNVRVIIIN
ncbi:hypothetical protein CHRYSEOSP005_22730 [Chryseobacterium sp. Alg-005]|uniref:hypothetical protein n=1 Tax=Chryseobacterium sp. Alg-005 TaxID=3159516 RepID=UPI003555ADA6